MRALIVVDIQNDFVPGGALAVPDGDAVIPVVNRLMAQFDLVVATQDWHPAHHGSFASQHPGHHIGEVVQLNGLDQILWPDHCVAGTTGAEFVAGIDASRIETVFRKGTDPAVDSYSGFFDNGQRRATGLGDYLKTRGVTEVFVVGLALDYCVKFTALDAQSLGFDTSVIVDATRAVNLKPEDADLAIAQMRGRDIRVMRAADISTDLEQKQAQGGQS